MAHDYSTETLTQKLHELHLPFADCFARALVALLSGRKISLHHVAHLMPGEQNPEANRQQMRRCLDRESLSPQVWTLALAALLPRTKWVLAPDRTEWKRGETTTNLLVLAVVTHGCADDCEAFIAVPLLWSVLPECGSSDTAERIELLTRFVRLFGRERLHFLTADREFIGWAWINWLLEQRLPFRIRITRAGTGTRPASIWRTATGKNVARGSGLRVPIVAGLGRCSCGGCGWVWGAGACRPASI